MKPRGFAATWGLRRGAVLGVAVVMAAGLVHGAEFYVGKEGNDASPGTRMQPFRTIGRAAEIMAPGDTCTISRGLYRETLRPPRSGRFEAPIRFGAATGETVTVSGADEVAAWSMYHGAVYSATSAPVVQVLVDDQPAMPDSGIPSGGVGAIGHWWQDTNAVLYAQMPKNDAPSIHRVEAQTRLWGIDLTGLAHIEVKGLNVFAAGVAMRGADHCRIEDCHVWWAGAGGEGTGPAAGIVVGGKDNEVLLTSIVGSAGAGVAFEPDAINNRLLNCLIRGTGMRVPGAVGILAAGTAQVIRQMTVMNCSGGAVLCSNLLNGRIEYCDLQHTGMGGTNISSVSMSGDGKGTVVAFNWIHDNEAVGGDGVRFGAGSENYILNRNVIWGQPGSGLRLAGGARYSFVCNNTVALCATAIDADAAVGKGGFKGMRLVNNIVAGRLWPSTGGQAPEGLEWQRNYDGPEPGFVDVEHRNFRLSNGSPCRDAGQEEPEFTEGYSGERPDIGAYESGGEDWVPGCRAAESANQVVRPTIRLVLDSSTPGSEVRYTLDGRDPTPDSLLYTGAVAFAQGATLRVRAYGRGMEPSPVCSVWVRQDP